MRLEPDERYGVCRSVLVGAGDAWWRLIFKYNVSKFAVLEVSRVRNWSRAAVQRVVEPLVQRGQICGSCIDPFTRIWAPRLLHHSDAIARRAHDVIRNKTASIPVSAGPAERKHLIGQESKATKSRGRARKAKTLSKFSYVKWNQQLSKRKRERALSRVLGDKITKQRFSQALAEFQAGGVSRSKSKAKFKRHRLSLKPLAKAMDNPVCRAYDIYVSETYQDHEDPDGDNSLKAKRRRTDESWRNLPDERRREYEEKAKEEAERRQRGAAMSFPEFLAAGAGEGIRALRQKEWCHFQAPSCR